MIGVRVGAAALAALLGGLTPSIPPADAGGIERPPSTVSHPAAQEAADTPSRDTLSGDTLPGAPAAASPDSIRGPGADLRVFLVTAGQGDRIWERFGHNGIRILDQRTGEDRFWEWGIFDFDQDDFILRLARGTMLYSMGGAPTSASLTRYRALGRRVWMQELALTPAQKLELRRAILENYRPENREYRYDYYRDNCSTRVRDMLDRVLDGRLRSELGGAPTGTTYRWHTRRLLARDPAAYAGIQFVLGNRAEAPIDAWEEAFLPMRLREHVRRVAVPGPDGGSVPLVASEIELLDSARPPAPVRPPSRLGWALGAGLLLALLLGGATKWLAADGLPARIAYAALAGGWTALSGLAGTVLLVAWLTTDHVFWAWNENLLQASPFALLLLPGLLPVLASGRPARWTAPLASFVALLSLAGFLLQPLPGLDQVNGEAIALALPANLALALSLRALGRGGRTASDGE